MSRPWVMKDAVAFYEVQKRSGPWLAEYYGVTLDHVRFCLVGAGIQLRDNFGSVEPADSEEVSCECAGKEWDDEEARRLYLEEGLSAHKIACLYDLCQETVYRRLRKAKVPIRSTKVKKASPQPQPAQMQQLKAKAVMISAEKAGVQHSPTNVNSDEALRAIKDGDVIVSIKDGEVTLLTWRTLIKIDAITGSVSVG